ncbi:secreted frizzled-related protein 1-like isoform X1 [Pecten maximus]|uniref:secreted frizzled-related protein 1-like isoform X1 n=1 Tax=Pecten maximus TaxID=6579 RepID=UPI0014583A1D|nr:secreted frizzled-related protein 1-like isoform X1 [Pecten maximus]XP_033751261.1 secreted frizzled-related protein 1-like isoform X1 [Pecten maximus]XP_033751262.1 secreted frizzled-related protein 1-like isoform X1 [Pecten maximus]
MRWLFIISVVASMLYPGQPASFTYDGIGYLSDGESVEWIGIRPHKPKCIDIPNNLTLCRGIGYTEMRLPNLLDHDTLNEVIQQSKSWVSLPRIHCHPDTQLFLCSLFSPVCLERTIKPCRSLCESVKAGCESKMLYYGYLWPDMVRCDKFPDDSDLCIQNQHNATTTQNVCDACNQPPTLEGIVDNHCRAQFVAKVKVRKIKSKRQSKILILKKKKKFYKHGTLTKREKRKLSLVIENGKQCECATVNTSRSDSYIIMGNKTESGVFTVSYISPWRKDREFKRALRKIKGDFDCSKIIEIIEQPGGNNPPPPPKVGGGRGGNRRGNRNRPKKNRKKNRRKNRRRKENRGKGRGRKRQNTSQTTETNMSG